MTTATLFLNGRSQAVRLPKEMRLQGKEVAIRRLGDGVYVEPVTETVIRYGGAPPDAGGVGAVGVVVAGPGFSISRQMPYLRAS